MDIFEKFFHIWNLWGLGLFGHQQPCYSFSGKCKHEDQCKWAHTRPIEWEAGTSKNNPGFDTSMGFQPGYQTKSTRMLARSAESCFKRQGEMAAAGGQDSK